MFHAEITVVCESVRPGCEFRALFYDRVTEQFYGGSGATALEALAWALDEYIARALLGMPHRMARGYTEIPGDRFKDATQRAAITDSISRRPVIVDGPALAATEAKESVGCFDRHIPRKPAPRLHGDQPSAAARRAAARRKS
jgi:hypothetical protein